MILPGCENPRNCVDPHQINVRRCISTPGSPKYVLPVAQSTTVTALSPYTCPGSSMMYFEAVIKRVWRCTSGPWSSVIEGVLAVSRFDWGRSGGRCDGSCNSIHWLTHNGGNVESWVQYVPLRHDSWLVAQENWSWDDAVLGVWSTRCMR